MNPLTLHPQFIERDGKKAHVVLPYEEFLLLQERLEDAEDLQIIRHERKSSREEPDLSLEDTLRQLQL